jgi:hypothetical protein
MAAVAMETAKMLNNGDHSPIPPGYTFGGRKKERKKERKKKNNKKRSKHNMSPKVCLADINISQVIWGVN